MGREKKIDYSQDGRILNYELLHSANINIESKEVICPTCSCSSKQVIAKVHDFEYATSKQTWNYNRCDNCGTVYLSPRPLESSMGEIYPEYYYSYSNNDQGKKNKSIVYTLWEILEKRKVTKYLSFIADNDENSDSRKILDVGCGDGRFLSHFRELTHDDWDYHGIEIGGVTGAKQLKDGILYFSGAVTDMGSEYHSAYDLICLQQVIEHVPCPRETIDKLSKLLKPSGVLVLETPDINAWDFSLWKNKYWGGYHAPRHFTLWNKDSLTTLASISGFKVISSQSLLSPVFWVLSLRNWAIATSRSRILVKILSPLNPIIMAIATSLDLMQLIIFKRSSNQRLVLRKI